ncbi:hypothetical protein [Sediminibacillus massiliensis]|nr:hypothetical protein [Sediminibacillus massiliensis]
MNPNLDEERTKAATVSNLITNVLIGFGLLATLGGVIQLWIW